MHIVTRPLQRGAVVVERLEDESSVLVGYGQGGACTLEVSGRATAAWIPLHGALRVQDDQLGHGVRARELLVTWCDDRVRALAGSRALWLAIVAGTRAWRDLLSGNPAPDPWPLPNRCEAGPALRRLAIALARATPGYAQESILRAAADRIDTLQAPLRAMVERCPGRTRAARRRVFVRLQRVRDFLEACCDGECSNATLARMANYSPSHFLRVFSAVYQESPHAWLVNQRLQRASRLLHTGHLTVGEVAAASGFENRSAFSRCFHERFGITASAARHAEPESDVNDA